MLRASKRDKRGRVWRALEEVVIRIMMMTMMTMMVKMVMMMHMIMMITRSRSRENLYTRERGERAGEPLGGALGGFSTGEPPLGGATVARIALS